MLPESVNQYLDAHRDEHLERLGELLRIPSIANADDGQCERAAEWCADYLRCLGLGARVMPAGGKPNVFAHSPAPAGAPTLLVYGHYDVQPADPLDLWNSPPFEPTVRDGRLYARGANDDKGQLFAQLMGLEAWLKGGGGLPIGVKVFLEGEEETGSPHLEPFLAEHAELLSADAVVVSDSEFFARGVPSLTTGLRGLAYFEVRMTGPAADLHSGIHGGAVANPVNALARLVAALHDETGRVTLDGFYDHVVPLADEQRGQWSALPFDEQAYARELGLDALGGGERGLDVLERRWARPTLDANGFHGGYGGPGSKTIIPSQAAVKISTRLVAHQDPQQVAEALKRFVAEHTPSGLRSSVQVFAAARPVLLDQDSPAIRAGAAALAEAFGAAPAFIRCGASIPVTELFQRILGLDAVLMGFGLPDDNLHSPNEKFDLDQFYRGAKAAAALIGNLREALR